MSYFLFEKNFFLLSLFSYWLIPLFAFIRKTPWRSCQTHTSLFPFLYTILVTYAPKSLNWNFSFMVPTVSIFSNPGSALTLICSVRNFCCSHFFPSWDIIQLASRTRSSRSFLLWSLVLRLLCWFFLLFPESN